MDLPKEPLLHRIATGHAKGGRDDPRTSPGRTRQEPYVQAIENLYPPGRERGRYADLQRLHPLHEEDRGRRGMQHQRPRSRRPGCRAVPVPDVSAAGIVSSSGPEACPGADPVRAAREPERDRRDVACVSSPRAPGDRAFRNRTVFPRPGESYPAWMKRRP